MWHNRLYCISYITFSKSWLQVQAAPDFWSMKRFTKEYKNSKRQAYLLESLAGGHQKYVVKKILLINSKMILLTYSAC